MSAGAIAGYEIIRLIGRGGTAEVWLARRERDGVEVALKRISPAVCDPEASEARASLEREAAILGALGSLGTPGALFAPGAIAHAGIVALQGIVDDPATGGVALVLEHLPGGSLADRISRHGQLPWSEVVGIAAAVAEALEAAHRGGIVHRDVKPANVLLDLEGRPRLADFGTARWDRATSPDHRGTASAELVTGTVAYLDPAVLDGRPLDERSDVYALGIVCFEALSGRVPFVGATPMEALGEAAKADRAALVERLMIDVPETPDLVARMVVRALAADPTQRFATAGELGRALEAAAALSALSGERAVLSRGELPAPAASTPAAQSGAATRTSPSSAPPASRTAATAVTAAMTMTMWVSPDGIVDDDPGPPQRRHDRSRWRPARIVVVAAMVAVATVAIVAATSARGDHGEGLDERPALAVAAPTVLPVGPADATGTLESTGPAGPAGAASRVDGGVAVPPRRDAAPAPESSEGEIEAPHPTGTADSAVEAPAVGAAETPGAATPAGVAAVTPSPPNDPAGTPATAPALQALAPGSATTVGSDGTVELLDAMGGVRRVRLGRPGDQVLLADWDCDGIATVGLYRAPSGVFYEFPTWNPDGADDAVASRPRITLAPGGTLRAHDPDADGCPSPVA